MGNFLAKSLPVILFGLMFFTSCGGGGGGGSTTGEGMHTVVYKVSTGSFDGVSISYVNEDGVVIDLPDVDAGSETWTYSFSAGSGTHLALSATLLGKDPDTIRVIIIVDDQEVANQPSYSVGVTASVEYVIP